MVRDLDGFAAVLDDYPDDTSVWVVPQGMRNSAGTLAHHVAGNLRHFVGAHLGGTGYVRDREQEFAARDLSRDALRAQLITARGEVDAALRGLDPARLDQRHPAPFGTVHLPISLALVHLATHLAYHLGQADIHRRVVTGDSRPVGAMGVQTLTGS
jgi:hypothetical protein